MFRTLPVLLRPLAAVAFGLILACGQDQSTSTADRAADTSAQPPKLPQDVLVTVNGAPIGQADLRIAMRSDGHNKEIPPAHMKNVLEVIVERQLFAQRAIKLGLDANPAYQEKLRRMEAQLNDFKRRELSELLQREIARTAEVSEEEAKEYFTKNAARLGTELHVLQILQRSESSIEQAMKELKQGSSFEEVAGNRFQKLPKMDGEPWDLGYLRWNQVPESWQGVVNNLPKGEVSGVIRGPNNRFWIIKLVDKRENPSITFESVKPSIMEVLKSAKIEALRAQAGRELRAEADIVYTEAPAPLNAAEEEE